MGGRWILLSAGEASGDMYGGHLAAALLREDPGLALAGVGGQAMADAGVRLLEDVSDLSVMGIAEVIRRLGPLRRAFRGVVGEMTLNPPAALVAIDFPGFNLALAREAKRLRVPVVYFVPPKLWVWGKWRMKALRERVDKVLAVFPFEEAFYRGENVPVEFVGNPLVDILQAGTGRIGFRARHGVPDGTRVAALLPGSRPAEVERLLPDFLEAARLLSREAEGETLFVLPRAFTVPRALLDPFLQRARVPVKVVEGEEARPLLKAADVALVASGTATLEAFLLGAPQVVAYKVSPLTYVLGKRLVKIPHFSLPNILAGRPVVTELIQHEVIPERLAREALGLLNRVSSRETYLAAAREVLASLKGEGATGRAARSILEVAHR